MSSNGQGWIPPGGSTVAPAPITAPPRGMPPDGPTYPAPPSEVLPPSAPGFNGPSQGASGPTAATAHDMLKALGIEIAFVVIATMVAGTSDAWATSMVALMIALLILRGLFEVDIFTAFASHLSLSSSAAHGTSASSSVQPSAQLV